MVAKEHLAKCCPRNCVFFVRYESIIHLRTFRTIDERENSCYKFLYQFQNENKHMFLLSQKQVIPFQAGSLLKQETK